MLRSFQVTKHAALRLLETEHSDSRHGLFDSFGTLQFSTACTKLLFINRIRIPFKEQHRFLFAT